MIFYKKIIFVISMTVSKKAVALQVPGSVCDRIAAGTSFDF
jgi:hypothetical protein